ncbi:PLP-dependent aminotransferase family protein [Paenibacillus methanolicus]|uniref:GntR family transcriptional regulator of abcA and norABC n=1 Tax=Paenibacillus methanolicus TaxID=582686 RepID=A0A5S5CMG9_9BACL|nr:PLP-dependent aminotransferase family protein [Paenibacillus methanolicus]TYP79578.1 GntR family transcriptional regulator of abcA and norABC [Paenibacillus methanolicus]
MNPMEWQPDRASQEPLHRQIEHYLKQKMTTGEWAPGMRIPAQRQLADMFRVNRSTIVTAVDELIAQGLLEGNAGGGTRVVSTVWDSLAAKPMLNWHDYIEAGTQQPNSQIVQIINHAEFQPGIIRLGTGELSPELLPVQRMQDVLAKLSTRAMTLGYEEAKGSMWLREALSNRMAGLGVEAPSSSILVVSGALQALQLISIGLLEPGSSVIVEAPSYLNSLHLFQTAGVQLNGLGMDEEGVIVQDLAHRRQTSRDSIMYTIPSFHNPTGIVMSEGRRDELIALSERERLPIIEDDVYRDLWLDEPPPLPLKARDAAGNVLYIGSFSKSVSPGLRIGWITGPKTVIDRLADIKMQTDYGSSSFSQAIAAEWLTSSHYDDHMAELRAALRERRAHMLGLLEQHLTGLAEWRKPSGGFYVWLRLNDGISATRLFQDALRQGILLNPGSIYDRTMGAFLRLSYAYASHQELSDGIVQLARLIQTQVRA